MPFRSPMPSPFESWKLRCQAPRAPEGALFRSMIVLVGVGAALSSTQRDMIIAYKLGATGKLPDTVGS